ncbi:MAG TPA: hypothetical protein VFT43_09060 [Candidatus Polarisedimenticolia bacterium]|nr:hypothetical protein [Candidatus Polarisedimenticolia bacterium]
MARTPDIAGALEAVIARTLKATIGPRFRKVDAQLRRLEKRLKKVASARRAKAARKGRRRGPGRPRGRGRRAKR